jgi:murein DD-endopeptidase MepM/ murein hydrolase activator NlpD
MKLFIYPSVLFNLSFSILKYKNLNAVFLFFLFIICFQFSNKLFGQTDSIINFKPPLDIALKLSGNFGDIRSNTYHFGIDFRTNEIVGYPVLSVADGYVARIKVEPGGYGRALYINHPNGKTSVYAHLNSLIDTLSFFVKREQYRNKSFYIDVFPEPNQFPVLQSQIIGYSGNAGMSSGPHLHFEIRDSKTQNTLNCLMPDFNIPDTLPPVFSTLWIYPHIKYLTESSISKKSIKIIKLNNIFHVDSDSVILVPESFGFGLESFDYLTDQMRKLSFYSSQMFFDSKLWFEMSFDEISFDEVGYVNSCIDLDQKLKTNENIYMHFLLPNQNQRIYKKNTNGGFIQLTDSNVHDVRFVLKDFKGNMSELNFKIKLNAKNPKFLAISDSLKGHHLYWNRKNELNYKLTKINIPLNSLYSDVYIGAERAKLNNKSVSQAIRVGKPGIPLKKAFTISIPANNFSDSLKKKLLILNIAANGSSKSIGGNYDNGYVSVNTPSFGVFALGIDSVAPKIAPLNISEGRNMEKENDIRFEITDNLSGIADYSGTIDDQWVLFEYDLKNDLLSYVFDPIFFSKKGEKHQLRLIVIDKKGNLRIFKSNFIK